MKGDDEIDRFLMKVKNLSNKYDEVKNSINIHHLEKCLQNLKGLVELNVVKCAIIKQIQLLIVLMIKKNKGEFCEGDEMLHSVFYGNPGVGKSKTAKILAEIWSSLNIIAPISVKTNNITNKIINIENAFLNLYNKNKNCLFSIGKTKDWNYIKDELHILKSYNEIESNINNNISDSNIVVAGRENFVAEFSGQTAIKSYNFLSSCLNKCLIIEEAYLLYHGESDTYGMEALTILNRFMDEHSSNLIVIFTGYEDKLKNTIFKAQPGLMRRCQWFFNLKGYSEVGLSYIFIDQLKKSGWNVEDENMVTLFFKENIKYFPHYGGDTLKLAFQCKLIYTDKLLESYNGNLDLTLNENILLLGFQEYLNNLI